MRVHARLSESRKSDIVEDEKLKDAVIRAAVFGIVGFAGWLVDVFACSPLVQALNLHAFVWHFLTAMALYEAGNTCAILATLMDGSNSA